jgi:hypothetical protein
MMKVLNHFPRIAKEVLIVQCHNGIALLKTILGQKRANWSLGIHETYVPLRKLCMWVRILFDFTSI